MTDKEQIENIIKEIAASFSGAQSTKNWTDKTVWFDGAPYACIGKDKALPVFDEAFSKLKSIHVDILEMHTFIQPSAACVCSVQKWDITMKNDNKVSLIMRQTDYLEKQDGAWKVLHEHTSNVPNWDGKIEK